MKEYALIKDWQKKHIHKVLNDGNLMSDKADIVYGFTSMRTEHTSHMTFKEAGEMIAWLENKVYGKVAKTLSGLADTDRLQTDALDKKRKAVISLLYQLPESFDFYYYADGRKRFDGAAFDKFLIEHDKLPYKKPLNKLDSNELGKLIAILGGWVIHYNKN